ncbi:MAG TPA: hypothetical protein VHO90_06915 [Bacteroidales bacterium]|nr:hypothetical protein [Bacteroidales bacterium]
MKQLRFCYYLLTIFLSVSCVNIEDDDSDPELSHDPSFGTTYQIQCFPDYANTGIYALDPRPLYKHILYRFDLASRSWLIEGDHTGLPACSRYNLLFGSSYVPYITLNPFDVVQIGVVRKNVIRYVNAGNVYEFNSVTKRWEVRQISVPDGDFKRITFNSFNRTFYNVIDTSLYQLDEDNTFSKVLQFRCDNKQQMNSCQFFSADSFAMAFRKTVYDKDPEWFISLVNVKTKKTETIRNDLLTEINPDVVYFDKFSERKIYALKKAIVGGSERKLVYCIDVNKNVKTQLPSFFKADLNENTYNRNTWGEIKYTQQDIYRLMFIDDNICLFWNEKGFLLNEASHLWEPLPTLEFETFNALDKG